LDAGEITPVAESPGTDTPHNAILDELLAEEIKENGGDSVGLCSGESPDKALQRYCLRELNNPGLKPHDRLKVIQTLDKVNARLERSATEQDPADELRGWISEVMEGGPGPCSEVGS